MKTVYILTEGDYSDYHIIGVYSTRELAQEAADAGFVRVSVYSDYDIEEHNLDENSPPFGMKCWRVRMLRNGDTLGDVERGDIGGHGSMSDYIILTSRRKLTDEAYFFMWARDEKHAVKIANERRAQLIANNNWVVGKETK